MNDAQFSVPILFLIFNRQDTAQQVFDQIKQRKPAKLYVSADGPRPERVGEDILCRETRDIVKQIDWECELHTHFLDKNIGCGKAICSAISWIFETEDEAIILEDDCLPHPDFFVFCKEMLQKYRNNTPVMLISGESLNSRADRYNESYHFSRGAWIWGWATWKRAWESFDIAISDWPQNYFHVLHDTYYDAVPEYREYMMYNLDRVYQLEKPDVWAIQWTYAVTKNAGLCIVPSTNLISNIGLLGVHSFGDTTILFRETKALTPKILIHPDAIEPNHILDKLHFLEHVQFGSKYYYGLKVSAWLRKLGLFPRFRKYHPLALGWWLKTKKYKQGPERSKCILKDGWEKEPLSLDK
ncbi:MAG: hypothetical protein LBU24_04930 [Methanocalculaceae archaeon]|nr:hypothetical protein [Methanocalculaceae archaeon]